MTAPHGVHDSDMRLAALGIAALASVISAVGLTMLAAAIVTGFSGGPWMVPPPARWLAAITRMLATPEHPGTALGPPWEAALEAHPTAYWVCCVALLLVAVTVIGVVAVPVWRRFGPATAGHASRADIRGELSTEAARRTAEWTRPSLTPQQRRQAPLDELAVPLHRGPHHELMCTPFENPTGAFAPTQSGKSRTDIVHKALAAPGALLCSTTKPDLVEFAALARTRRANAGPVLVFDTTGQVPWPAKVRWSPTIGCRDFNVARRRAETLVDAAAVGMETSGGNEKVFRRRAKMVVQCYLIAAAYGGRGVADLVSWAITKPPDHEPVELLRQHGFPELANNLRSEIGMVAETSDAVWLSVRGVIEPWLDPHLRDLCSPRPGEEFDTHQFIDSHGSLFIVAGEHQAAQVRPVLTALVEDILTTEQEKALAHPSRRLDPPATNTLDELFDATPVPRLPEILADSAGRGVLIHWAAQSLAHLDELYGENGRRQLLDNTTILTLWGGIKDPRTLEWISTIGDHHDRRRYQQQSDGFLGAGRTTVGTESVPTYRPGAVRTIARGRVLVIHRHLKPILGRTVDVSKRADWNQIKADQQAVRAGHPAVDERGYRITPVEGGDPA